MEQLIIGIPARDEGKSIAPLADALELGSARLGEAIRCTLVLAYQAGTDDTLNQWESRLSRIPQAVLHSPEGLTGKGRNVKLLIRHAQEVGAHLLLVDADLRAYPPTNVGAFVHPETLARAGLILPLWCRPRGQGNSTDYLACPLLFAVFGARLRQPLAGQMLLGKRLLSMINVDELPDDYGIDVDLTMRALDLGLPVNQVLLPFPEHDGGGNSHRIMADVAAALLARITGRPAPSRHDVCWPERYWEHWTHVPPPTSRSLEALIDQVAPPDESDRWREWFLRPPDAVREMWCERLANAVRGARQGHSVPDLAGHLVYPFLLHAEYRRQLTVDLEAAEAYIAELSDLVAAAVA